MKVHVVIELTRDADDGEGRRTVDDVMGVLEEELDNLEIEVDGALFSMSVVGIGRTSTEVASSVLSRRQALKS